VVEYVPCSASGAFISACHSSLRLRSEALQFGRIAQQPVTPLGRHVCVTSRAFLGLHLRSLTESQHEMSPVRAAPAVSRSPHIGVLFFSRCPMCCPTVLTGQWTRLYRVLRATVLCTEYCVPSAASGLCTSGAVHVPGLA
jgi:hypothetical protein